jgi:hypothetical protein
MKSLALRAVSALAFVLAPALAFAQALNPVSPQAAASGGYSYSHIAAGTAATFVIKASAGWLHSICYNGPSTASNVTTVYDNATGSGTVIAVPLTTGIAVPGCEIFDIGFVNGLTIITGTANGSDMTVSFK